LIVDADALFVVAGKQSILKQRKDETILTPHVGELSRIIGKDGKEIEEHRVDIARSSAKSLGAIVVLKGAPTVTAVDDGDAYLNSTGNPGMATAGAGDVLAGIIAALVGQGLSPGKAAVAGVYIHGLAGDLAEAEFGQRGMMAMDILDMIPAALRSLEA
jgi:NAD(P)H-hydrate epimerase